MVTDFTPVPSEETAVGAIDDEAEEVEGAALVSPRIAAVAGPGVGNMDPDPPGVMPDLRREVTKDAREFELPLTPLTPEGPLALPLVEAPPGCC